MEVEICVPPNADMAIIDREYPDISEDSKDRYFVGRSSSEDTKGDEWLTYDEAVACCGFVEGAMPGVDVKWLATEDGSQGKGTGRHIACFVLKSKQPK